MKSQPICQPVPFLRAIIRQEGGGPEARSAMRSEYGVSDKAIDKCVSVLKAHNWVVVRDGVLEITDEGIEAWRSHCRLCGMIYADGMI